MPPKNRTTKITTITNTTLLEIMIDPQENARAGTTEVENAEIVVVEKEDVNQRQVRSMDK